MPKLTLTKFSESMVDLMDGRAICIDKSHQWYGLIFFKDPDDCSWVSKRKATRLEMSLAFTRKKMIKTSTMSQNEPLENQLTDNSAPDNTSSPEEEAEFRRIEAFNKTAKVRDDFKASMIKRMAAVARQSPTISAEAMCTELFNAGCRFADDKRQI